MSTSDTGDRWDAGLRWRLAAPGFSLFVFLTAELFPIGALPQVSAGLDVPAATTGLLLMAYAVIAGESPLGATPLSDVSLAELPLWSAVALLTGTLLIVLNRATFGTRSAR